VHRRCGPASGTTARSTLTSSQAPIDSVLTALLNSLGEVRTDVILVLDDYHVIERPEIHDGVGFLIDHLPAHVHAIRRAVELGILPQTGGRSSS